MMFNSIRHVGLRNVNESIYLKRFFFYSVYFLEESRKYMLICVIYAIDANKSHTTPSSDCRAVSISALDGKHTKP